MLTEPTVQTRDEQAYVAVPSTVAMDDLSTAIPASIERVAAWLERLAVEPTGRPFVRYRSIDMPSRVAIEVGFPVPMALPADDGLVSGTLPAGSYVTAMHTGDPKSNVEANAAVLDWAKRHGVGPACQASGDVQVWESRLEILHSEATTKLENQRTEIAFLATRASPAGS